MRARLLLNLALLAVVVGLGLVLVLEPGREAPVEPVRLTSLEPDAVTRVRIESPGAKAVHIERRGEQWRLQAPLELPADRFRVEVLARAATAISHARYSAREHDLSRFGLAEPRAVLYLNDVRLAFGDTEPLSSRRYVLIGDTVHLAEDRFLRRLTAAPASFVDSDPLAGGEPVALDLPGVSLSQSEGRWRLSPQRPGVSADALTAFADAWRNARAFAVSRLDPELELEETVTVRVAGRAEPLRFRVARTGEAVVLARPAAGIQYHFAPSSAERLLSAPSAGAAGEPASEGRAAGGDGSLR